jgi:hypothetical protein
MVETGGRNARATLSGIQGARMIAEHFLKRGQAHGRDDLFEFGHGRDLSEVALGFLWVDVASQPNHPKQ